MPEKNAYDFRETWRSKLGVLSEMDHILAYCCLEATEEKQPTVARFSGEWDKGEESKAC